MNWTVVSRSADLTRYKMNRLQLLQLLAVAVTAVSSCKYSDWSQSFDNGDLSKCDSYNNVIQGFYRNYPRDGRDDIALLEKAMCCSPPSPWSGSSTQISYADWLYVLDGTNTWATCPNGFFLNGLYRSGGNNAGLRSIEYARCSKPSDHPSYYGQCYDQDVMSCFDDMNLCQCKDGYYVTGLYKSSCEQLHCLETLRCCQMAKGREVLDETYKVKNLVMDLSMSSIANLANMLGYGWCAGCLAPYVGEAFNRQGNKWVSDKTGTCDGYMSDQRLAMDYKDWGFEVKEIKFGKPVIEELTPESIDSGTMHNNDATEATKTITREQTVTRSVTHTTTSEWKDSHELGITVGYTPPAIGGMSAGVTYTFNYETSSSTTDETKKEQSSTFSVTTSKVLKPYSAVKWDLILSKTRTTVPYTATILTKFSTELQGFLRWGGGASHPGTNYHYKYRGSGDRPTFNYRFGDSSTPFYTALKRESDTNSLPWLWNDMANAYSSARSLIKYLSNEDLYVFTLTGKFEDVVGKNVDVRWDEIPNASPGPDKQVTKTGSSVARAGPSDKPTSPEPPKVEIKLLEVPPLGERYDMNSTVV
ncbi:uncharacterized protein LOC131952696 [Physella acuta]|uniref:uncharacterized protein LOC131952696 n=1 Tax=Physella acuta TaxID=109671 RepID=UPI0027DD4768|nr:uncharacterized protein LOC131952696 [Physella acuta]